MKVSRKNGHYAITHFILVPDKKFKISGDFKRFFNMRTIELLKQIFKMFTFSLFKIFKNILVILVKVSILVW